MSSVIAIAVSDIHLSLAPPLARMAEPDWLAAQKRVLDQVGELSQEWRCSVLCAGDVFDRWNAPPELINVVIECLGRWAGPMVAVPGQHDLPLHRMEDIERSAYWTLVKAGVVQDVRGEGKTMTLSRGMGLITGFGWGQSIQPCSKKQVGVGMLLPSGDCIQVCLSHQYVWTRNARFLGAPTEANVGNVTGTSRGYDVVVFGDNHKPWIDSRCKAVNPGCLIRRKQDEREQTPHVVYILDDGSAKLVPLDAEQDQWTDPYPTVTLSLQNQDRLERFLEEVAGLDFEVIDFRDVLQRYLDRTEMLEWERKVVIQLMEAIR